MFSLLILSQTFGFIPLRQLVFDAFSFVALHFLDQYTLTIHLSASATACNFLTDARPFWANAGAKILRRYSESSRPYVSHA